MLRALLLLLIGALLPARAPAALDAKAAVDTEATPAAPTPPTPPTPAPPTPAAPTLAAPPPERVVAGHTRFDLERADITVFVDHLVSRGFDRAAAFALLAKAEPQPGIIDAMNRPAEKALAWWEYRARFLSSERIEAGARLWREHRELLDAIAIERHVSPEYLLGILGIETSFGRITGRYRVLDALTTLAFDYPARSEYFQQELEQFLLLCRNGALDPLTTLGSYAGAMGVAQFMPSSFQRYAVHEGGAGHPDLWNDWADIFASIGNYLREHGWEDGQPVLAEAELGAAPAPAPAASLALTDTLGALRSRGMRVASLLGDDTPCMTIPAALESSTTYRVGFQNFYVITRYNRSPLYAMAVHDLAQALVARVINDIGPTSRNESAGHS